jgi:hypothetical protein
MTTFDCHFSDKAGKFVPARDTRSFATALGWVLILGFCSTTTVILILGRGALLKLVFPLAGTGLGGFLFATNPPLFLGYAWWIWFLTPEIRRIADFQGGWTAVNPLMLTPLLVSGLCVVTLVQRGAALRQRTLYGFAPILLAIFYGTIIGIVTTGASVAVYSMLTWLTPVLLAFHVAARSEDYPTHRSMLLSVFSWGTLVMGAYGLYQYVVAPDWDGSWIINSGMINQGRPEPQAIRVFSTLNSSGPFAFVISAGILMLAAHGSWVRLPMAIVGIVSLLLSLVRAAWLTSCLGYLYLLLHMKGGNRLRLALVSAAIAGVIGAAVMTGPLGQVIEERFDTLSNVQEDASYQQRQDFYLTFVSRAFDSIVGEGIGSTSYVAAIDNSGELASGFNGDSGILQIPFALGWIGGILYVGGLAALLVSLLRGDAPRGDIFIAAAKAIVFMIGVEMLFENTLINITGACFWTFLGMGLAAQRYEKYVATVDRATQSS